MGQPKEQEEISQIVWRVDGKVAEVQRTAGSSRKRLKFDGACPERRRRDAMGQRIAKHEYAGNAWEKSTYYVRDAQGNVLATYNKENPGTATMKVTERDIYGSSRVGMYKKEVEMISASTPSATAFQHETGLRQYELSNHLGNVLAVITDRKRPLDLGDYDVSGDGINDTNTSGGAADNRTDYYQAEIVMSGDYSPFGVALDGRTFSSADYRYGFNGQEKDDEVKGSGNSVNFEFRFHDPRLGRFFSTDPLAIQNSNISTYNYAFNNPVTLVDLLGLSGDDPQKKKVNIILTMDETCYEQLKETKGQWVPVLISNVKNAADVVKAYCEKNNCIPGNIAFVHHGNSYGYIDGVDVVLSEKQIASFNEEKERIIETNGCIPSDIDDQLRVSLQKIGMPYVEALIGLNNLLMSIQKGGSFVSVACEEAHGDNVFKEIVRMSGGEINIYMNSNRSMIVRDQLETSEYNGSSVSYGSILNHALTSTRFRNDGWFFYNCKNPQGPVVTNKDLILSSYGNPIRLCAFGYVTPPAILKYFSIKYEKWYRDKWPGDAFDKWKQSVKKNFFK